MTDRRITRSPPLIAVHRFSEKCMSKNGFPDGWYQSVNVHLRQRVIMVSAEIQEVYDCH